MVSRSRATSCRVRIGFDSDGSLGKGQGSFDETQRWQVRCASIHLFICADALLLFQLRFIPQRVHLDVIRISRLAPLLAKPVLNVAEPAAEFSVRSLQRAFRVNA